MSNLYKALLQAQKSIENAKKDSKNPHFKSNYASLEAVLDAVKPVLNECGLVLTQEIFNAGPGFVGVRTRITHADSGESTADEQVARLVKDDPQGHGSAVTYLRRYGVQAICAIASEDDDGNDASAKQAPKREDSVKAVAVPVTKFEPKQSATAQEVTAKLKNALPGFKLKNPNE